MRTKTGELLMRKKNQLQPTPNNKNQPIHIPMVESHINAQSDIPKIRRNLTHVTNTHVYNFVSVTNKLNIEKMPNQILKQMQLQNYRLIQANMKLVNWVQILLQTLRQKIERVINLMDDFRYLIGVAKLKEVLAEITDFQKNGFNMPRTTDFRPEFQSLKKINNSESKQTINFQIAKLDICPTVFQATVNPSKIYECEMDINQSQCLTPTFVPGKWKRDYAQIQASQGQTHMLTMLLMQSMALEQFIH